MPIDLKALAVARPAEPEKVDVNDLVASPFRAPREYQSHAPPEMYPSRWQAVGMSADLDRILKLPRRPQLDPKSERAETLIEMMTARWSRGERACRCAEIDPQIKAGKRQCLKRLNAIQAWALYEIGITGGCIGFIAVGAGKCLPAGAEIFDVRAGRRRDVSEPGALGSLAVPCVDRDVIGNASLVVRPAGSFASGSKPCVRVDLCEGSSIEASTDHPILTSEGWAHAEDLKPGDFVAIATAMPEPETPTEATDEEIALIGLLLGDGGCSQAMMNFTNMTPSVIEEFMHCAEEVGYEISERPSPSRARQFWLKTGNRVPRASGRWSKNASECASCETTERPHCARGLCGACYQQGRAYGFTSPPDAFENDPWRRRWNLWGLSKEKRMHPDLWGLPRRQVALLVNRFWACDGHVSKNAMEITLASEKLLDDVRFLMLRLGVRSRKHYKKATCQGKTFDAWRLHIAGADALRFFDEVGDILGKEEACQALRAKLCATRRNTNFDVVPIGPRQFREVCAALPCVKYGQPGYTRERSANVLARGLGVTEGQCISRQAFKDFCLKYDYHGPYSDLLIDGVAWERVESVTDIGVKPVFDLTVPGPANFVANGIVVHNSILDIASLLAFKEFDPKIRNGLLLVPPGLIEQLVHEYDLLSEHFVVPELWVHNGSNVKRIVPGMPVLHVRPYSLLSKDQHSDWIKNLAPQVIIADESDKLRIVNGAGTSRVIRHFLSRGDTLFAGWSGSFMNASIMEFYHLMGIALRYQSPVPLDRTVAEQWDRAIGAHESLAPPGELLALCKPGEHVRAGFGRRLAETMGVIVSSGASVDVKLTISERPAPTIPQAVEDALHTLRSTWVRLDGEELIDAMSVAECARQYACGLYLQWWFPRGEPEELIKEWLLRRKVYNKEARSELLDRREFLDSPKNLELAAQRYHGQRAKRDDRPEWASYGWPEWSEIKGKVKPKSRAVWIDEWLARDAAEWAVTNTGIVWYGVVEFGRKVAEIAGLPLHGGGADAGVRLIGGKSKKTGKSYAGEDGSRSAILSIDSHHRGRDGLQRLFRHQLIANMFGNAAALEQLFGRLHRQGQLEDVTAAFYGHTEELEAATALALRRAECIQEAIPGNDQKFLAGFLE